MTGPSMTALKAALPLVLAVLALACAPHTAAAGPLLSSDLQAQTVFSKTYTTIGANSTVYGNVLSGAGSTIGASGSVSGNLVSAGAATLGAIGTSGTYTTVSGSISSGAALTTGDSAVVGANITISAAATIGTSSQIGGSMVSGGAVTMGVSSTVSGSIQTGGVVDIGASASVVGNVATVGAITLGVDASVGSQTTLVSSPIDPIAHTASIDAKVLDGAAQIAAARSALSNMGAGTMLATSVTTDQTLAPGVYSATALTTTAGITFYLDGQGLDGQYWIFNIADGLATGASTSIELINSGPNSGVIWNVGSYATLGANSTFLGTILANSYITVGADVAISDAGSSYGSLYSETAYVVTGATVTVGGIGYTDTDSNFNIASDGTVFFANTAINTPEPASWALLITGLLFMGMVVSRRTRVRNVAA